MTEIIAHHGLLHDTKLHVDDYGGPGRPVVLIHGWPLSGASWSNQIHDLQAAGFRPITYDRRGFGRSDKPAHGYDYDTLTEDLHKVLEALDLHDVTLVGFSMGGGEVARYASKFDNDRVRSVVFAAAVPPYLAQLPDNPEGPLPESQAAQMTAGLTTDREKFFDQFVTDFFTANGELKVTEAQRQEALELTTQASKTAALEAMAAFAHTDFRDDLTHVHVPTLVLHGDADAVVPFEGSGKRTHEAIAGSQLVLVEGAPHGFNVSHADRFNLALTDFLATS